MKATTCTRYDNCHTSSISAEFTRHDNMRFTMYLSLTSDRLFFFSFTGDCIGWHSIVDKEPNPFPVMVG